MDPDRPSLVTQDKFGTRFNKREGDSIANESAGLINPLVSPPLSQEAFGASIIRTANERGHALEALEQPYDRAVSPEDESYGARIGRDGPIHQVPPDTPYDPPYNQDAPYDPPSGHEAQIAMRHMDEPQSATIMSPMSLMSGGKQGDYGYISNRNTYDSDTRSLISVAKKYDHHDSRKFLIKTGSYRFSITLFFCILIAFSLKAYEGFRKPRIINKEEVRIFNAIMIGLSLGLGLNLASSLKRYVVILRWSLLTKRYVSLEVFDLILGLETLTKVGKLMVISIPGIKKISFLRKWPWFRDARDDGTRLTWLACLLWIIINIGAQVLVAALSLFWPVDPSDAIPMLTYGDVSVSDLTMWTEDPPTIDWNASSLQAAWSYGNEATAYPVFGLTESQQDLSSLAGTPLYKGDGFYEYRFLSRNPEHLYTNYMVSTRKVQASASCEQLEVRGGREADEDGHDFVLAKRLGEEEFSQHFLSQWTTGSLTWTGSKWEHCGPRCTNFTVYQDADDTEIATPSLFFCENKLSAITGGEKDFNNLRPEDNAHIYSNDEFARIASGAMAWTGYNLNGWNDRQTRSYLRGSKWSPYPTVTKSEVEDLLARYTIGAIAAFDDHGIRWNVTNQNTRPVQGQQLQVDWAWVLALLGAICFIQLAALVALISFANKSIIRDESFFSLAMLLSPVISKIGKEGMNLSGDEIKTHPKLRGRKIRYDYREGKDGEPNQVDIFFKFKDMDESRRSWVNGVYA